MKKKQVAISILSAMMVLPLLPSDVYASEKVFTDHNTYIEDGIEYNLDGSIVTNEPLETENTGAEQVETTEVVATLLPEKKAESVETKDTESDGSNIATEIETENEDEKVETSDETNSKTIAETINPLKAEDETSFEGFIDIPESDISSTKTSIKNNVKKVENVHTEAYIAPLVITYYGNNGYIGELNKALKNEIITRNYEGFLLRGNPFSVGQCTWYAWSRFYQVYGFDSGTKGNGKENAREIVKAHPDLFELSNTPAAGATFSMEYNTLYPEYGHVGFVEAYDGEYLWISEGNVSINDSTGNIWVHKVKLDDFMAQYPDVIFAIPKEEKLKDRTSIIYKAIKQLSIDEEWS